MDSCAPCIAAGAKKYLNYRERGPNNAPLSIWINFYKPASKSTVTDGETREHSVKHLSNKDLNNAALQRCSHRRPSGSALCARLLSAWCQCSLIQGGRSVSPSLFVVVVAFFLETLRFNVESTREHRLLFLLSLLSLLCMHGVRCCIDIYLRIVIHGCTRCASECSS